MYICQNCGEQSAPRQAAHRVVVETREKIYPYRSESDPGGKGFETVKELLVCANCVEEEA